MWPQNTALGWKVATPDADIPFRYLREENKAITRIDAGLLPMDATANGCSPQIRTGWIPRKFPAKTSATYGPVASSPGP